LGWFGQLAFLLMHLTGNQQAAQARSPLLIAEAHRSRVLIAIRPLLLIAIRPLLIDQAHT
jgi:hypothetical protein